DESIDVMRRLPASRQHEAAYLAGLSAFQMEDIDEAELRLSMAARASDPSVAANARAMLGLVRLEQGRHGDAASLLTGAADALNGDDAFQAARFAELASRGVGTRRGRPATRSSQGSGAGFTIQAGAFRERDRAEAVAMEIAQLRPNASVKPVQILQDRDSMGRPLYLVQFGRFSTRHEAASIREQLGRRAYIVTPVDAIPATASVR
ncbi:MAG: SPOR domain-containing protein, partial [Planctomycetota bacterium]